MTITKDRNRSVLLSKCGTPSDYYQNLKASMHICAWYSTDKTIVSFIKIPTIYLM